MRERKLSTQSRHQRRSAFDPLETLAMMNFSETAQLRSHLVGCEIEESASLVRKRISFRMKQVNRKRLGLEVTQDNLERPGADGIDALIMEDSRCSNTVDRRFDCSVRR